MIPSLSSVAESSVNEFDTETYAPAVIVFVVSAA